MPDKARDERIMFLLKVWMRLDGGLHWPCVKEWVENQLNDEFPEQSGGDTDE